MIRPSSRHFSSFYLNFQDEATLEKLNETGELRGMMTALALTPELVTRQGTKHREQGTLFFGF